MLSWKFHQYPSTETSSRLTLSSKSRRTWRFLMTFWSLSYVRNYHIRALLKILSKSEHRKPIKNNPVLQVSSWSLGGHGGSWWCWIWYLKSEYVTNLILFFIDSKNMVVQAIFELGDKIGSFWPKVNIVRHSSTRSKRYSFIDNEVGLSISTKNQEGAHQGEMHHESLGRSTSPFVVFKREESRERAEKMHACLKRQDGVETLGVYLKKGSSTSSIK